MSSSGDASPNGASKGTSLVFLNDPSRLQVNQKTAANLIRQQDDVMDMLLQCFCCGDSLAKKEEKSEEGSPVSIRMKISSRLRGKKEPASCWYPCPCCSSVTCTSCLSLPVLEGSTGFIFSICVHCFANSSRVRHPLPGRNIASYHTSDPKAFNYMWNGFKHTYSKVYSSPEEEERRAVVFANNLLRIDVLNENSSQSSTKENIVMAGINRHADISGSEYSQLVQSRSRLASDLILQQCHESRFDLQDLKRRLSELILQSDFQQFTDTEMDAVIDKMQSLLSAPTLKRSISSSSDGDHAVNVQELETFCQNSLVIMRQLVPKNIFYATEAMLTDEYHYSHELASRLLTTKCLWLITLETADLHQISIADLMSRYAIPADLDLVESAALLSVLPKTFLKGDIDGDKRSWRKVLTVRVAQLYKHQQLGTLRRSLMRHSAYPDQPEVSSSSGNDVMQLDDDTPLYAKYSSSVSSGPSSLTTNFSAESADKYDRMPNSFALSSTSKRIVIGSSSHYEVMPSTTPALLLKADEATPPLPPRISELSWPIAIKVIYESELVVGDLVGKGSFGIVRRGTWRGMAVALKSFRLRNIAAGGVRGVPGVVARCEELSDLQSVKPEESHCWKDFQQEVKSMTLVCHHMNVVQLVGVVEGSSALSPCIVTVFYKNGSLYDKLIKPHKKVMKSDVKLATNSNGVAGEDRTDKAFANEKAEEPAFQLLHTEFLVQWALETARGVFHLHQEGLIHRDLAARNLLLVIYYRSVRFFHLWTFS